MTQYPGSIFRAPMQGAVAWREMLDVKHHFLASGDVGWRPPRTGDVRNEILLSWRRCVLSGVDPAATLLPRDEDRPPPARLVEAAQPVLDRLRDQLAGMHAWAFLTDPDCRLIARVVGEASLAPRLDARGAFPGALFGEDLVGTNGLGTTAEQLRPFIVAGSEHFREYERNVTTAGAPVRDPATRRLVGLLDINCRYEFTNAALLPYVAELARTIGERLHPGCGHVAEFEAVESTGQPSDWLSGLRSAACDADATVILRHVDDLDPGLAGPVASLLEAPKARLAATAGHGVKDRPGLAGVVERLPVVIDVPPLRERAGDIPALVTGIISERLPRAERPGCTPEATAALLDHQWPGNLRELRQVVLTALVRSMSCDITVDDLPGMSAIGRRLTKLERLERNALVTAVREAGGDVGAAARDLGVSRATMYRKLRKLCIQPPRQAGSRNAAAAVWLRPPDACADPQAAHPAAAVRAVLARGDAAMPRGHPRTPDGPDPPPAPQAAHPAAAVRE